MIKKMYYNKIIPYSVTIFCYLNFILKSYVDIMKIKNYK